VAWSAGSVSWEIGVPWELRFSADNIEELAARYNERNEDTALGISALVSRQRSFSREQFLALCRWKSPRILRWCRENTAAEIEEATRVALSTPVDRLRIGVLRCLRGVGWPMASVLLHFGHADRYPILDFRALWSLGFDRKPGYTFELWWQYVTTCRTIADDANVSMRALDRALWQFSKENQV